MISAALIIMLSTVMFGMSGDGGQQPVAPKKEVVNVSPLESPQGENKEIMEQTGLAKESATVKDWFGFDTGMTEKEFQEHQEAYIRKYFELHKSNVTLSKDLSANQLNSVKKSLRDYALSLYEKRLNLNILNKLERYGIKEKDFFMGGDVEGECFPVSILKSPIILHGKIVSLSDYDKLLTGFVYELNILDILKGKEYYQDIPLLIKAKIVFRRHYEVGDEIIAFLGFDQRTIGKVNKSNITDTVLQTTAVRLAIDSNKTAHEDFISVSPYSNRKIGTFEKILDTIKDIELINDTQNFYKIKY